MQYLHPTSASMAGDTSPVYAPPSFQKQSCAPRNTSVPFVLSDTDLSATNEGNTATSTVLFFEAAEIAVSTNDRAPAMVKFIFQLPAISRRRSMGSKVNSLYLGDYCSPSCT